MDNGGELQSFKQQYEEAKTALDAAKTKVQTAKDAYESKKSTFTGKQKQPSKNPELMTFYEALQAAEAEEKEISSKLARLESQFKLAQDTALTEKPKKTDSVQEDDHNHTASAVPPADHKLDVGQTGKENEELTQTAETATGVQKEAENAAEKAALAAMINQHANDESRAAADAAEVLATKLDFATAVMVTPSKSELLKLKCPYEQHCSKSELPESITDKYFPAALNLLLLWLVREALYKTIYQTFEKSALEASSTYTEDFTNSLSATKQNLISNEPAISYLLVETIGLIKSTCHASTDDADKSGASVYVRQKLKWKLLSEKIVTKFATGKTRFNTDFINRLYLAFSKVFDLFDCPDANGLLNVGDLMSATLQQCCYNPVLSLKLRMIFYVASSHINHATEEIKPDLYPKYYRLFDKLSADFKYGFESLKLSTEGVCVNIKTVRAQYDQAHTSVLGHGVTLAAKYLTDTEPYGNLGVCLARFIDEVSCREFSEMFDHIQQSQKLARQ